MRYGAVRAAGAMLAALLLCACSVNTTVSTSATVPAQVQHLYVTVEEVWLTTSATAAPADTGWIGQALDRPVVVDLAALDSGTVSDLVSGIKTPPGTYRQLRLVLADAADPLTPAATGSGLTWNAEVQYLGSAGSSTTLALDLPNRSSQLVIPATIILNGAGLGTFMSGASGNASATGSTAASGAAPSATSTGAVLADVVVDIAAIRHLLLFEYGNTTAALLDPRLRAVDAAHAGGISGSLDLSAVNPAVLTGTQGVVVTAERLSVDGSRFEPVKSVAVPVGGAFTLYPLPVADSGPTTYDLVIHGPGIRTEVISAVPVTAGAAADATVVQSSPLAVASARSYTVNVAAGSAAPAGGATAGFYQTIPGFSAPHLIEYETPDPFNGGFIADLSLSADIITFGSYASGSPVNFSTGVPGEGAGTYRIGTFAPLRTASSLVNTISAPTAATGAAQPITLPALGVPSGGASMALTGTINTGFAGRFDRGFVLVSSGGELIDTLNLQSALTGAGPAASFSLPSLPAGIGSSWYEVTARLWNSRDPSGTLVRTSASSPVNAAAGGVQSVSINVP